MTVGLKQSGASVPTNCKVDCGYSLLLFQFSGCPPAFKRYDFEAVPEG